MMEKRLPWSQQLSYGVGHSLNDLTASMWFSYLIVYLQLVLGFDANYAGFVLLIGQVADAIATPLLGYEVSQIKDSGGFCKRYGRRKFLHLIGTVCVVLSFPFLFSVCPGCERASQGALTVMLAPLVVIFQIGWASVQVSHLSLIPVITPHESERDFLNVLRYAVNIMSDMSAYVVVWCVFDLTAKPTGNHSAITRDYADKFLLIVLIVVCIGAVFSAIFHLGVRERPSPPEKEVGQEDTPDGQTSTERTLSWRDWLREIHFYQVGLLYTTTRLFSNITSVFIPLYLQQSLKAKDDFIAKIPLVMMVSGFVVSCLLPKLFRVFSKKVTFLAGAVLGIGACVWVSVGAGPEFASRDIYAVGALLGAAGTVLVVCALSFIHDLIADSPESGAFVYGCMSFWDKMANGVAAMTIQYLHTVQCGKCDWFYRHVISYGVGGTAVVGSIILVTLLPAKLGQRQSQYNSVNSSSMEKSDSSDYGALEHDGEGPKIRLVAQ